MNENTTAWLTALAAVLGPLGVWLFRWVERKDQREDREVDWRSKRETNLYERQDQQLDRAYKRINELEEDVRKLEEERDRAWQVAWGWYIRTNEIRHELLVCRLDHPGYANVPLPELPAFNDIIKVRPPQ